MAFKGFFKAIKNEFKKEVTKQIEQATGLNLNEETSGDDQPDQVKKSDAFLAEGIVNLLGGGGGGSSSSGMNSILSAIQGLGGLLPMKDAGGLLPGILKVAEMIGRGMGDDTPRTEKKADGSFIDGVIKTIVDGRKIHSGEGTKKVKELMPSLATRQQQLKSGQTFGVTIPSFLRNHAGFQEFQDQLKQFGIRPFAGKSGQSTGQRGKSQPQPKPSNKYGERGSGFRSRGSELVQDYDRIKESCLAEGSLFEDPEFPADMSSLFYTQQYRTFQWARPNEIASDPQFFVDDASRFDVKQGELGDCWLLAAVANLTLNQKLFFQIVPQEQSFTDGYCGIFHFRFWQYGRWVDVVIDDRLPIDSRGRLVFMHSEDKNEFWSALLEKAYAKLHGSYEALKGGTTCEALEDFTGGVTEMYEVQNGPPNLFKIMMKANERSSFMGCSIEPDPRVVEAETPEGLIRGHAYSITDVKLVDIQTPRVSGKIPLLRIRNPWGNEAEWKGAWSDGSQEWQFISDDAKEELGLTFDADGEFWMSFKDFTRYFQRVEICNLSPDSLEEEVTDDGKKKWEMGVYEGSWIRGATSGGCRNYIETFGCNPQYIIELSDPDEDDDDEKCTVIIALMQKNRRAQRKLGVECLTIGFAIYHLADSSHETPLPMRFFKFNASVARSPTFINLREVSCRFKLPPGRYCIVPSTFEPNEEGDFLLRVFSESKNNMQENDTPVGLGEIDSRFHLESGNKMKRKLPGALKSK